MPRIAPAVCEVLDQVTVSVLLPLVGLTKPHNSMVMAFEKSVSLVYDVIRVSACGLPVESHVTDATLASTLPLSCTNTSNARLSPDPMVSEVSDLETEPNVMLVLTVPAASNATLMACHPHGRA